MPKTLTPLQGDVLRYLFESGAGASGYFLTGGTALAEYYLEHRSSDDLDLFNRSDRDIAPDAADFLGGLESRGILARSERLSGNFARLHLSRGAEAIRIDLANDVKAQMAPLREVEGIRVDSLEDIAVNKVCALFRQEPKDYVDLYFILTETSWTLESLLSRAGMKDAAFDDPRTQLQFAHCLSLAGSFTLPPFMLKPLDVGEMQARLYSEAKKIFDRLAPGR